MGGQVSAGPVVVLGSDSLEALGLRAPDEGRTLAGVGEGVGLKLVQLGLCLLVCREPGAATLCRSSKLRNLRVSGVGAGRGLRPGVWAAGAAPAVALAAAA